MLLLPRNPQVRKLVGPLTMPSSHTQLPHLPSASHAWLSLS